MRPSPNTRDAMGLLRAVARRSAPKTPPPPVGAVDFDWKQPHRFGRDARGRLKALGEAAAEHMARQLTTLFRKPIQVVASASGEHYAAALKERLAAQGSFFALPIIDAIQKQCGFALLSPEIAFDWVDRLLGGGSAARADGQARTLAMLEATLLVDIVGVMLSGFTAAAQACSGPALKAGEAVATDAERVLGPANDILCGFDFEATLGGAKAGYSVFLLADALEPVAEPEARKKKKRSLDDVRKDMIAHLEQAPIQVAVRLGEAGILLGDAMALEPGDVLVLTRRADEPVELTVCDHVVTRGFPVQTQGFYGLKVSERRGERRAQLAVDKPGKESKS